MKRCTLKFAISTLVSLLVLTTALAIGTAVIIESRRALRVTTYEMMAQISRAMSEKLTGRLDATERLTALLSDLIRDGRLDPAREEVFTAFLRDMLVANPDVDSIDVGLPSGHKYQARRMPDGSISRRLVHRTPTAVVTTWHHDNPACRAQAPDSVMGLADGYDPRLRPWWKAGTGARGMVWTDIYPNGRGLNYSNVNPVRDRAGRLLCIVAIDLNIGDLSVILGSMKVPGSGKAFIIDRDSRVVALSMAAATDLERIVKRVSGRGDTEFALRDPEELRDGDVRTAVMRHREAAGQGRTGYLRFKDPSGRWVLASFRPEPAYRFTFGVVVPEEAILGPIKRSLRIILAVTALGLAAAFGAALAISRAISKPLATLAREVDRIRGLDLGDGAVVATRISEVRTIDESIRNMKKGLRSFKKYVPAGLVLQLMALGREAVIEGEKRELTIFFSDIADFTSLAERMGPDRLVEMLGDYFEGVTRAILDHGGRWTNI
jgi:adenylate cyclase